MWPLAFFKAVWYITYTTLSYNVSCVRKLFCLFRGHSGSHSPHTRDCTAGTEAPPQGVALVSPWMPCLATYTHPPQSHRSDFDIGWVSLASLKQFIHDAATQEQMKLSASRKGHQIKQLLDFMPSQSMHMKVWALPAESSASALSLSGHLAGPQVPVTFPCAMGPVHGLLPEAPGTQSSICSLHTVLPALNIFLTISSGTDDLQGFSCPKEQFDYFYTAKNINIILVAFHV